MAIPSADLCGLLARLQFQAARVEDGFGVAARLLASLEDEIAGGLEGDGALEIGGNRPVKRIALRSADRRRLPCA